jgi:hypothetical protein
MLSNYNKFFTSLAITTTLTFATICPSLAQLGNSHANRDDLGATSNLNLKVKQYSTVASQVQLLNGTWEGTYVCRQGLTSIRLTIAAQSTNEIDAVFYFSAHPRNPSVPSGAFRMVGTYRVFNSTQIPNLLELKPTNWINRPRGYGTVGLSGNVFPDEQRIVGEVTTSGCDRFDVIKVD